MSIWAQFYPGCKLKTLTKQKDMHILVSQNINVQFFILDLFMCDIQYFWSEKAEKEILYLAIQYEYLRKTRASKPLNCGLPQKQGVYQFQCLSSEETEKHMKSRLQNIYSQHTWLNMCIQEYQTLWTSINKMLL